MVPMETVLGNTIFVEKRTNVWPLIQKRTKCIRHLALFINLSNSANLSLTSEVTLIFTIRLTVQYRDKYLRQGKNHHKNKNELLLLGHNLKIALLSLTRFSLEKRKNPSWKVLDVGCTPLSSLMGVVIFSNHIYVKGIFICFSSLNFTKETNNYFFVKTGRKFPRFSHLYRVKLSQKSQFWSNLKHNNIWNFLIPNVLDRCVYK